MVQADTLPKLLREQYRRWGTKKVAMRKKKLGIWHQYTWQDVYEKAKYFSLGMIGLGLQRGDKVAGIGDNDPEWYWGELGIQAAGGIVAAMYIDMLPAEVNYIVTNCDARFVMADDQESVDKLLQIKNEIPLVEKVIYWDAKGMRHYDDPWLIRFDKVLEMGKEYEKDNPELFEQNIDRGHGEDICLILYTSGTTKLPKGALLTHRAIRACYEGQHRRIPRQPDENTASVYAMASIGEQGLGLPAFLVDAIPANFPEEPETAQTDMREIAPNGQLLNPRMWEVMASDIRARMLDADVLKRFCYDQALRIAYKVCDLEEGHKPVSPLLKGVHKLADFAAFRPIRDYLGFAKARFTLTGGAPIGRETFRYFRALGVPIVQGYGMTETAGVATLHALDDVRLGTCGRPIEGVEIKISEAGEILIRGDNLFNGYYKMPEATAKVLVDGWYHTGDAGYFTEDGHLVVIDRIDELVEMAGGEKFSATFIENVIKFSPYIKDVMCVGGKDCPFVVAIVGVDLAIVGNWAEKRHISYTTLVDLSQRPEVYDLVEKEIQRANELLPERVRVKRFLNLLKEFDVDEAELTRTRKLRRNFMSNRYQDLIELLYSDKGEYFAEAPVVYRDGRRGVVRTKLFVRSIGESQTAKAVETTSSI